jgi:hypothetical protein
MKSLENGRLYMMPTTRNVNKMEQAHIGTGERIVTRSGWGNREGVLNARTP